MEGELKNFIKIWIMTMLCLSYCHYIVSRLIPKGIVRLISLLPVFYLFITIPLNLHSFHLCGPTTFFLVWFGIFKLLFFSFVKKKKLLLFSFDLGPNPKTPQKPRNSIGQNVTNKSILLALKALVLGIVIHMYEYRPHLHPYVISVLYCCHMYLALELVLLLSVALARAFFGFELKPQFNEPYLSTSLQDFWGRRWNLMITNILRPTVYDPIRRMLTCIFGQQWTTLVAVMCSFVVSGLMHEVIYYYVARVPPAWEVTWFFVLHGVCLVVEVELKKAVAGRWRLHLVVSRALTLVFLAITAHWLFFPQLLRNGVDTKALAKYAILGDFVKAKLPIKS